MGWHSSTKGSVNLEAADSIVPNGGKTVFHALSSPGGEKDETAEADDVLKFLMTAYKI